MQFLFAGTLFLAAALLMFVQPLCARMVLPVLGGTPSVWNTCMVFFQCGLLAGYGYAHWSSRWLGGVATVLVQLALLGLAFVLLPIALPAPQTPPQSPTLWLLESLIAGVALPFVVIAATGPLLQRWFAAGHFGNPYFLYVASNIGSFVGLLAYPFVVEPVLSLQEQSAWWRWGCMALIAATLCCGVALLLSRRNSTTAVAPSERFTPPTWGQRLHWLILALAPSSLLLCVTNYLATDIAAIPLLWVVPLAIYLLTFSLVFSSRPIILHKIVMRWQPLAVIVLMLLLVREATEPLGLVLGLHLMVFFWIAMSCHGELARTKPAAEHLTDFYLWLAVGGALGGAFNALAAPLLFSGYAEYPLMIAVAAALRHSDAASKLQQGDWISPVILGGTTAILITLSELLKLDDALKIVFAYLLPLGCCYLLQARPARFGLAVGAVLLASMLDPGVHGRATVRIRSFFGVHRVTEQAGRLNLVHGNTIHGQQFLDADKRRQPLTYYHETGPIGRLLKSLHNDARLERVGLVGLGAGSLAAYAQPGQRWTFFEIDPAVIAIARDRGLFTFLRDCRGALDYVAGDARLTLQYAQDKFGLIIIDAFGSDAIPLHLLTREAMQIYRSKLHDNGILAFHISNRYVDLEPVLANHALEMKWSGVICEDLDMNAVAQHPGKLPSTWMFLTQRRMALDGAGIITRAGRPDPSVRAWTDDFANIVQVLRWRGAD